VACQHILQFSAQPEHLVSIREHQATRFCQDEIAAFLFEQLAPNLLLKIAQLSADRLWCQEQRFSRLRDRTVTGNRPEVAQVFEVELQIGHRVIFRDPLMWLS
jgi:hypothetical protein